MISKKSIFWTLASLIVVISLCAQRQQEFTVTALSLDHGILPQVGYEFSLSPKNSLYASIGYTSESVSTGEVIGIDTILFGPGFPIEIFDHVNTNILLIDLGYKFYFKPKKWNNHRFFVSVFVHHRNFLKIPEGGIVLDKSQFGGGYSFGYKWIVKEKFSITSELNVYILGAGNSSFDGTGDISLKLGYVFNAQDYGGRKRRKGRR